MDRVPATKANMRKYYPEYGNALVMRRDEDGETFSANPDDYFDLAEDGEIEGCELLFCFCGYGSPESGKIEGHKRFETMLLERAV